MICTIILFENVKTWKVKNTKYKKQKNQSQGPHILFDFNTFVLIMSSLTLLISIHTNNNKYVDGFTVVFIIICTKLFSY